MYEYYDLSNLYQEVNTSAFTKIPFDIFHLIWYDDPVSSIFMKIKPLNITLEDEIAMENIASSKNNPENWKENGIMSNNMRFYFNRDVNIGFFYIKYSIKSHIDENKNNNFCTFFIGDACYRLESQMIELISAIVWARLEYILNEKYNLDPRKLLLDLTLQKTIILSYDFINTLRCAIDIYVCMFRTIDNYLDLKYEDFDKYYISPISELKFLHLDDINLKKVMRESYYFAITENNDPGDYNILVKKCCKMYFEKAISLSI